MFSMRKQKYIKKHLTLFLRYSTVETNFEINFDREQKMDKGKKNNNNICYLVDYFSYLEEVRAQ